MKEKGRINLKNTINLKNLYSKKTPQTFNLQRINMQTISKEKCQNYIKDNKNFFISKIPKNIRYLNSSLINTNLNNDYSFYSYKEPSPINSLNSSPYSTYTKKRRNYKRLQKKYKNKYHNFNINSSNSINNLSLNSKIINTNESVSLNSSCSSKQNDCTDSSNCSYRSRKNRRKKYKEQMMADDKLDYLERREVGLISSEEEEIEDEGSKNYSLDSTMEDNYNNDIERILIEIYNNNISLISSGNYKDKEISENKIKIERLKEGIKRRLSGKDFGTSLLTLKCLSNTIKELVCKYKEKVFELEEIKNIYEASRMQIQQIKNYRILHCNSSVGSNVATNSNSYDNSYDNNEEENNVKNIILLYLKDDDTGKDIANILLRELINIKNTLKISSREIESIFEYPLSLL